MQRRTFYAAMTLGLFLGGIGCSGGGGTSLPPVRYVVPPVATAAPAARIPVVPATPAPVAATPRLATPPVRVVSTSAHAMRVAPPSPVAPAAAAVTPAAATPVPLYATATPPAPRALAPSAVPLPATLVASDLRVMTFNLRVATAFDALNTWQFRKGLVVERIRTANPDLLGTQEGLNSQGKYLQEQLPGYTFFGAGREDGKRGGEFCGVFYKTARFDKLDGGHFWLSEKPEKPGTKGWGAWFPRMVTWVKLRPRDGSPAFVWFNTHFDAFASKARTQSARLLLERMATIAGSMPTIVTGDFNADPGSEPYRMLCAPLAGFGPVLVDAFRAANPSRGREEGTMHNFNGHKDGGRIDWILASPAFRAVGVSIDRSRGLLGYPSDHFPVIATFRPASGAAPSSPVARIE